MPPSAQLDLAPCWHKEKLWQFLQSQRQTGLLPDPAQLSWSIQDVDADGTGRNQNGDLFRDRVAVKRKLTLSWPPLAASDMSTLLSAVTDTFFTVSYPDALTGETRSMTAYVGDRTAPMYSLINGVYLWNSLSMNFIER